MTTSSINPHAVRPVLVEVRSHELRITPDRDFDRDTQHHDWSRDIIRACTGPFERIEVDLGYRPMISSTFFAGALRILDHYRHEGLQRITLRRVSTRIARTIEMMNMRETFTILPD
jgi:anti-anti-sigma regulatory factor